MWLEFFAQNIHFAINLFTALVCAAICWLYFDAWMTRHAAKELIKWIGFGLLAVCYLLQATVIEEVILAQLPLGRLTAGAIITLRLLAYAAIIVGQLIDPLQTVPQNKGLVLGADGSKEAADKPAPKPRQRPVENKPTKLAALTLSGFSFITVQLVQPLAGLAIAGLYWRRATTGFERHLKPVALGFLLLSLADLLGLATLVRGTSNPILYTYVAAFGWIWILAQLTLLAGALVLGRWVWSYLVKRFFSQLFMIFIAFTVVIFLLVAVGFTALLLRSTEQSALANLETAAHVLDYALTSKQAETTAAAQQLAGNSTIATAVIQRDRGQLLTGTTSYLADKHQSNLIITDINGQVLLRGEDTASWGDSLSDDPLVKRALLGLSQTSTGTHAGVGAPTVDVRSAVPLRDAHGTVVGSVLTVLQLDSGFVDGVRSRTGLASSIYAGDVLAATTLTAQDGTTRDVGIRLTNKAVTSVVIGSGQAYRATFDLQNRPILAVFLPLRDVDNAVVGMLMTAQPQSVVLQVAATSVELTFLLTALLLLLCVIPVYWITKSLTRQLE